jgi:hypothetical protein
MSARGRAGETLNGTNDPDLIKAFGGNDIVNAKDAADDLSCGDGDYELNGQNGNDCSPECVQGISCELRSQN